MTFLFPGLLWGAAPAFPQYTGYWHTSGARILDSAGKPVRIGGVNWYGFETTDGVVHGLTGRDYKAVLANIQGLGFNTVRLPYSNQMVEHPTIPANVGYSGSGGAINSDLKGLNSLQILDKVMAAAGKLGLKVILDNHRSEAGNSAEASGLWYTNAYPESQWIADWKLLAARYANYTDGGGNPTLIGVDLRNEPHLSINGASAGACWTGDRNAGGCLATNATQNWPAAAARAGNAVLSVNSKLLIFVEGVDCYNGDCDFWGGNLEGAKSYPVQLNVAQRLVYSAHDYGPTEYRQPWFNGSTTAQALQGQWTKFWAYLSINGTAPVWVGEFGTTNDTASVESSAAGSQGQWFSSLVNFLGNQPSIHWTYWALNGEDNYGLLDANYDPTPPSSLKQSLLSSIEGKASACGAIPATPGGLSAKASSSSAIALAWTAVSPPSSCSITYSAFRSTTSGFTPSATTLAANGISPAGYTDTGLSAGTTYYYRVEAVDAAGASPGSAQASAKTAARSASSCHVNYTIASQWATGFQAGIAIVNTGSTAINSWTLKFTFPGNQQVTSLWNAGYSQTGETLTLSNESYNGSIPAGGSYSSVGFTGSYSGTNQPPSAFELNGVVCK